MICWSWGGAIQQGSRDELTLLGFFQVNGAFHVYENRVRDYGSIYGLDSEKQHTQRLSGQEPIK